MLGHSDTTIGPSAATQADTDSSFRPSWASPGPESTIHKAPAPWHSTLPQFESHVHEHGRACVALLEQRTRRGSLCTPPPGFTAASALSRLACGTGRLVNFSLVCNCKELCHRKGPLGGQISRLGPPLPRKRTASANTSKPTATRSLQLACPRPPPPPPPPALSQPRSRSKGKKKSQTSRRGKYTNLHNPPAFFSLPRANLAYFVARNEKHNRMFGVRCLRPQARTHRSAIQRTSTTCTTNRNERF